MPRLHHYRWFRIAALALLAGIVLWPGVHGGFLFDDTINLESLGAYGPVRSWPALERYLTSGIADPTGRPLAMLSFLLDANNWPADPYPFKVTNLLLHLLNGSLLFAGLFELGLASALDRKRACNAATLGAGLWTLHPLFVSTTMYIVQREAMLPATFAFIALWIWLRGRRRVLDGHPRAVIGMAGAVVVCTLLSIFSKANGILLPPLLLVVECCLPRASTSAPSLVKVRRWLLWLPTVAVLFLILTSIPGGIASALARRPWTLGQRMLTEPRILFDYLGQLWIPRPFSRGLFNDGYRVSTDLWHPWTTVPAIMGIVALATVGWWSRKRAPAIAMAIGFFLVGQSIESGPIALELYFEHRNYLPAALMFWPLAVWLTGSGMLPRLRNGLAVALPLVLALETWMGSSVWGSPDQQALLWGIRNPDSPRAQAYQAQYDLAHDRIEAAERRLRIALAKDPMDVQLLVNLIGTRCRAGDLSKRDLAAASRAFAQVADPGRVSAKWMERALPVAKTGNCKGFGIAEAGLLAQAFHDNPRTAKTPGRKSDAEHLLGEVALDEGKPELALEHFNRAYEAEHKLDTVLVQSAMLASAQEPRLALQHLALGTPKPAKPWYRWRSMVDVNVWVMYRQGFWQAQIDELRVKIERDLRESKP